MGDALLATCLAAGLLLMSIVLLLCLKGRNRSQDDAHDYEPPDRRRQSRPNQYMALQNMRPGYQSSTQESPPHAAVPSYENAPASATVVEEGRQPSGNPGHPSNGVNNASTGRQGLGSMRRQPQRQAAVEDEGDVMGGGGAGGATEEAGPPVVPPRRGASGNSSGGGEEDPPSGVPDVTSSRDTHPADGAPPSANTSPQVPRRRNELRRQEAVSESASVAGSSDDASDDDIDDTGEDRLQHPNGGVSGNHGNRTAGRGGGESQCSHGNGPDAHATGHRQKRDFSEDLETVAVTPDGVVLSVSRPPCSDAGIHTFPRATDARGSPHVTRNGKSRTLGHFEEVVVGPESVQILTSLPSASGGANASIATQRSDRDDNSDVPPPVPRRPRNEGVGVVRLKK